MMENSDGLGVVVTAEASNSGIDTSNSDTSQVETSASLALESATTPSSSSSSSSIVPVFDFNVPYMLPAVKIPAVPKEIREEVEMNYRCPVSQDLWFDPVQTPGGKIYEREEILTYLALPAQTSVENSAPSSAPLSKNCPLDGTPLEAKQLVNIAQQLLNFYRKHLQGYPQLWHEVYIAQSYQQALQDACFAQGTVSLEIQVRRHALALTHVTLPTGYLLVEALCEPHVNTRELLPWVTAQLKPEQWQDLVRQRSVQHWLQRAASAVFHAETAAVGFVKALEQHLNLSFEPQALLNYALSLDNLALVRLALACYPELMTAVDANGNTPLHRAVSTGNALLVETLLQHGANAQAKNQAGKKPVHLIHQSPPLTSLFAQHQFRQSFNSLRPRQQANIRNKFSTTAAVIAGDASIATGTLTTTDASQSNFIPLDSRQGSYGVFTLTANGAWTYRLNHPDVQSLSAGQQVSDTFPLTSFESTVSAINITITGTNDAPMITDTAVTAFTASSGTLSASPHVEGDLQWFETFHEPYQLPKQQVPDIATIPQWLIAENTGLIAYDPYLSDPQSKTRGSTPKTFELEEIDSCPNMWPNAPLQQAIRWYLTEHPELNALQYVSPGLIGIFKYQVNNLNNMIEAFRNGPSPDVQHRMPQAAYGETARIYRLELEKSLRHCYEKDRRFLASLVMEIEPGKPQTLPEIILRSHNYLKVALLPTWLELVTPFDWQEMLRHKSLQDWLGLFARVMDYDANLAIQAIQQMQQGLALRFNPLAFVQYAIGHEDVHLLKLAIACYPEVIYTPMADNGNTLLHIAVQLNAPDKVKCLVEAGACINIRNQNREKPLDLARHLATPVYNYLNRCKTMQRYERLSPDMQAQTRRWIQETAQPLSTMPIPSSSSSSSISGPSALSSSQDHVPASASLVSPGSAPGLWGSSVALSNRSASQSLYEPQKPASNRTP